VIDGATSEVSFGDGVTFTRLRRFKNGLRVTWNGFTTPPISDVQNEFDVIYVESGAELRTAAETTAIILFNPPSETATLVLDSGLAINCLLEVADGIELDVTVQGEGARLGQVVQGTLAANLVVRVVDGAYVFCGASDTQPSFAGIFELFGTVGRYGLNPQDAPSTVDFALLVDTVNRFISNDVVIVGTLPPASSSSGLVGGRGQIVVVKHAYLLPAEEEKPVHLTLGDKALAYGLCAAIVVLGVWPTPVYDRAVRAAAFAAQR
jgi:hypothetical protein